MAKRSKESFQKRAREKARQEKQAEKRARRQVEQTDDETLSKSQEDALMQQFARLSSRYESEQISSEEYDTERQRIFEQLGLESGE